MTSPELEIVPLSRPPDTRVRVPGSKSITNRALIAAALAEGRSLLTNALFSDDTLHMAGALRELGFELSLDPGGSRITLEGQGGRIPARRARLYAGGAGTAMRFLAVVLALGEGEYTLDGDARMRQRPMGDLVDALRGLGVRIDPSDGTGGAPFRIQASGLPGGRCAVRGNVSSQFLSALLLAAPYARSALELTVEGDLVSRPYVDMTLTVMREFGVRAERSGVADFRVPPGQRYRGRRFDIESDASSASYFFAAAAVTGGRVTVQGISRQSMQGDIQFLDVLETMGCQVAAGPDWVEVTGPSRLQGVDVDMSAVSDTALTLAAIAPFATSPVTVRGIAHARAQESDRVSAVVAELRRVGVEAEERPDGFRIGPAEALLPGLVRTYNDHRMAMAFSLIGLRVPGLRIENPGCVAKTFPDFFDVLETLRG